MFPKELQNLADNRYIQYELICPVYKKYRNQSIQHKFETLNSPLRIPDLQHCQNHDRTDNKLQKFIKYLIFYYFIFF